MRHLRIAPRIHDVDLGGHLVRRPQPRGRHQIEDGVAVVVDECRGIGNCKFLERVPDAVIGAWLREVIADRLSGGVLLGDEIEEDRARAIDDLGFHCTLDDEDAWAIR